MSNLEKLPPINTLEIVNDTLTIKLDKDAIVEWFSSNHAYNLECNELIQFYTTDYVIRNFMWETIYESFHVLTNEDNIKFLKPKKTRAPRKKTDKNV